MANPHVYDPSSPTFQLDIWQVFRKLRDSHPVYYHESSNSYVLSRFADVWAAIHDPTRFSNEVDYSALGLLPGIAFMDPPRHTALRGLVSRAFSPSRVRGMSTFIRETSRGLLSSMRERGAADLQAEYAAIIPTQVIGHMIGVPPAMIPTFRRLTEEFLSLDTSKGRTAAVEIYALFRELLAQRKSHPSDDLLSALISAEIGGQRLSEEEALGFCLLLIVAGNDTTASAIGSGAVLLARHPDQRAALLDDPELWRDAVEEIVRIETPAQRNSRKTTCTVEVAGFVIPEGSTVGMLWGAANHDEREFDQPERFDIRRNAARHLGFGRGIHFCLGASLARLEISIALAELVEHFPDYELSSSPTHVNSEWARCHESIPVGLGRTRSSFR